MTNIKKVNKNRHFIKYLAEEFIPILKRNGFKRKGTFSWERKCFWKIERIEIIQKYAFSRRFVVNMYFDLPRLEIDGEINENFDLIHFDQKALSYLMGAEYPSFKIPIFSFFKNRFKNIILQSLPLGVEWFDNFKTYESALKYLIQKGKGGPSITNFNPNYINSPNYKYLYNYFENLIKLKK